MTCNANNIYNDCLHETTELQKRKGKTRVDWDIA